MSLRWSEEVPRVGEYQELRRLAGLARRSPSAAAAALAGGLAAVTAREGGRLVAMGRLVGDGGAHAMLADVAVDPDYRGRGLGREVLTRLVDWADAQLPAGCEVTLIAEPGSFALFRAAGFEIRTGMVRPVA